MATGSPEKPFQEVSMQAIAKPRSDRKSLTKVNKSGVSVKQDSGDKASSLGTKESGPHVSLRVAGNLPTEGVRTIDMSSQA